MNSQTAFVTGAAVLPRSSFATGSAVSSFRATPVLAAAPAARPARIATTPTMIGDNKDSKKIPQGFTPYAEVLNGRAAMFAILASWPAEILNPAHPTVVQQVQSLFDGIAHLF